MIRSLHCVVSGKVQGTFFRAWAHDQADALGVKGWARNVAEGKVEILAQGVEENLDEFKKRLMAGSPVSSVTTVEAKWIDYDKEYPAFEIR